MKILAVSLFVSTAWAADVSGTWELSAKVLGDTQYVRITLKADGNKVTGNLNELKLEGATDGDKISFTASRPNGEAFGTFEGSIRGGEIVGTALWRKTDKVEWTARRPAAPPSAPRTLDFEPKEFHRVFSDAIPPVMHVFPGDTVRTWTVDAGGTDPKGVRRSGGGNPETGPFYIEGAFPGDTLVVKLDKVRLNRDSAGSGDQIVDSALNGGYLRKTKYKDNFDSNWVLDSDNGVARLKNPSEHLKNYTVKLQPMMGCIAVAPQGHQALQTGHLGSFGGNMDYNQMREGTTIYLPVYAPGALLFIGDGHAAQGDGELTGDALETSMRVEFTVSLIKGEAMGGPRAENDEYLMSLGIGNSLEDALRSATTRLVNWLQKDYKLEPNEAAIVLGTAMRYDIAEVVDPLVHVVAKIRKDALVGLK
ncbi:MAG TPA: acetamidase/formamidase family protein [Bryobacteraceae bacterium]|nr:acetamidase/formamidase family protein [Bryobacteraceae bacterium]